MRSQISAFVITMHYNRHHHYVKQFNQMCRNIFDDYLGYFWKSPWVIFVPTHVPSAAICNKLSSVNCCCCLKQYVHFKRFYWQIVVLCFGIFQGQHCILLWRRWVGGRGICTNFEGSTNFPLLQLIVDGWYCLHQPIHCMYSLEWHLDPMVFHIWK